MKFKKNQTATKLRGGYYTDERLASFMLKWVLDGNTKRLLEPGCGDGNFLSALSKLNHSNLEEVDAFEIEPEEASVARQRSASVETAEVNVYNRDYLKWSVINLQNRDTYDAVVGNPPFVRYQYLDDDLQNYAKKIFEYHNLSFTRHTNLWVPFVVAAMSQLRAGGKLAMVLPAELLHVRHSQSLRSYLAKTCSELLVIDPKDLWFEDTLQGAIILLAKKKVRQSEKSHGVGIVSTRDKSFIGTNPESMFHEADFLNGETIEGKWMPALLETQEREALLKAKELSRVYQFDEIGEVAVGIVTGANKFFLVPDSVIEEYSLWEWAHPMFGRSKHVPGVVYDEEVHKSNSNSDSPTNFIWFEGVKNKTDLSDKAREYIEKGEKEELHERYKCRIREPWFEVPSVYSTKMGMLKRCHHYPRVIYNKIEAYTTDTAYRIKSENFSPQSLSFSFVNSLTALSAELEGRHYGGGVLELVPSEIRRLLLPEPIGGDEEVYDLDKRVRQDHNPDELLRIQDKKVLGNLGFDNEELESLHSGWKRLRDRRQRI